MFAAAASISVVIPTRDRPKQLRRAARSVLDALRPEDELIVVDSAGSDPAAVEFVMAELGDGRTRLVRTDRPGVSLARNVGSRAARHDLVGFVDDDVLVDQDWAAAMARCFEAHPDVGFISGRLQIPAGQGTLAVAIKDDPAPASFSSADVRLLGHSASLAVPRARLLAVGGFDELLGAGAMFRAGEDVDLFDRLLVTGAVGRYEPAAIAQHEQWRRIRQYLPLQHSYGYGTGARLSKLRRTDPRRFQAALRTDVWEWGVLSFGRELLRRDWFRAAGSFLRLLGALRGFVRASFVRVEAGHFRLN